jgi:hypothetical protein
MKYFLENIDESISVFDILDTDLDKQRTNLVKLITTLSNLISEIDPDLLSDTAFLNQITILRDRILKLIDKID